MNNQKYSKYLIFIIMCLSITYNSIAGENIKTGVKMLDLSSVPDSVFFFDEKEEKHSLDKFEGKTILLVFWATWCPACVKEMPDLDILQKDFRKLPFEIIPISQDYQAIEVVQKYYQNYEIRYLPLYHDFKNQLFKAFGIVGLPTAILINTDGKKLVSFVGSINWYDDEIRQIILSHIPGNHPEPKNSYQEQSLNQSVHRNLKAQELPAQKAQKLEETLEGQEDQKVEAETAEDKLDNNPKKNNNMQDKKEHK